MIIKAFEKRDYMNITMKSIEHGVFQGPLYPKSDDVGLVKRRRPAARLPSRSLQFPPRPAGV